MNTTHDGLRLSSSLREQLRGPSGGPPGRGGDGEAEWRRGDGPGFEPIGVQMGLVFPESSANNALCDMTESLIKTWFPHLSNSDVS